MALRIVLSQNILRNFSSIRSPAPQVKQSLKILNWLLVSQQRDISQHRISSNIELVSNDDNLRIEKREGRLPLVSLTEDKPLVVLLSWVRAKKKHVDKYSKVYLEKGYDVMAVYVSAKQLFAPTTGTQVIAREMLDFLFDNWRYSPMLIHGFSVGGYLWGEVLVQMNADLEKYKPVIDRIIGQIWDSTPDITEFKKGFPHAVFPKIKFLRYILEAYIDYHLKTFYDSATQHYIRSSQMFHTTSVRAPALVFVAKNDPIASLTSITKAKESWESMGMKTYMKCWEKSRHVSHFHIHRKEYLETLESFLTTVEGAHSQKVSEKAQVKI